MYIITRKTVIIFVVIAVALFAISRVFVFFMKEAPSITTKITEDKTETPQAKYIKGNVAFLYPAKWKENDIVTAPGFISVQVVDLEDTIVFVASSGEKLNDNKINGEITDERDVTVGGISGKERRWENEKSQAVVFRADNIQFENKYYRFEMFGMMSRKIKMEQAFEKIIQSVKFEKGAGEGIQAMQEESSP